MNSVKSLFLLTLAAVGLIQISCLDGSDLDFPDEEEEVETTESVALITYLDAISKQRIQQDHLCFEFVYPIDLGYNNGIALHVESREGLIEASTGQSDGFHVHAIAFPFLVNVDQTIRSIKTEADLVALLADCGILTFKDLFKKSFGQCYDFSYPVQLIDAEGTATTLGDHESVNTFIAGQASSYQPGFQLPLNVIVYEQDSTVEVENYYQFHQLFVECEPCPHLFLTIDEEFNGSYIFRADFDDMNAINYTWYLNNDLLEVDGVGGDNQFHTPILEPGIYEVCVKAFTPDCQGGAVHCETFEVGDPCPELTFEADFTGEVEGLFRYEFNANFPGATEIPYTWVIRRNEDIILLDTTAYMLGTGFMHDFGFGIYEVCIETETTRCPEVRRTCKLIDTQVCPEPHFIAEREGTTPTFEFFADFAGMNEFELHWEIFSGDDRIFNEEEAVIDDKYLLYQFGPGVYQVCLSTITPLCPDGIKRCQEVVVE